ncbi:MAG: MMPL family transporter [Planctomycetales bacterium]|nr:MMPL family transporter [Planctomycetales bacterium]
MTAESKQGTATDAIVHRKRLHILLFYVAVASPFIAQGAIRAMQTNANSPVDWVSDAFPAKAEYEAFRKRFGTGDVVVMSWPGCTVENSQLDELLKSLRTAPAFHDDQQRPWFERVTCGREEIGKLTSPPVLLSRDTAIARLRGTLVGNDENQTCVVVAFNAAGLAKRSLIVPRLQLAVEKFCEVQPADIHMAGPVMDGMTVDHASKNALDRFAPLSSLVVLGLCWICLDSIPMALLVFGASLLCQAATLAIISWCGDTMSALLIVMPPLIQVLAVAGGVHLANYYFDEARREGLDGAAVRAFRLGWLPCSLSSATTAIGLGSLMVSHLVPVRAFGAYAAVGVSVTLAVLLSVIPGILLIWPVRTPSRGDTASRWGGWDAIVQWIAKRHIIITSTALVGMIAAVVGTTQLQTSVQIETLFGSDSRLLADYRWLESHIGPLVPVEVIVNCDDQCQLSFQERLRLVSRVEQTLQDHPKIDATTSAVSFLPPVPRMPNTDPRVQQIAMSEWARAAKSSLMDARYLVTDEAESFRVTGFASALDDVDFGLFLSEIRAQVEPLLRVDGTAYDGVQVQLTGIMPLVHEIQRQLLEDLFASFVTAFVVIAIVMTLVQAGIAAGLIAMIPNVFPTLLLFGVLGWRQFAIDIGSVMTASVALGIAVDDTLHFLTFFRRQANAGATRHDAVLFACQHCGKAMLQTTLICGLGLMTFAFADFVPTSRFAWMMLVLLVIAIIGDLVVLPALLLGPAGRLFIDATVSVPVDAKESEKRLANGPQLTDGLASPMYHQDTATRSAGQH